MLHVERLTKIYHRDIRANDGLTFDVASGEVVGLLWHNGAGKTLLNQVVGLAKPTSGRITLLGRDPVARPSFARAVCSFQPQTQAIRDTLTTPANGISTTPFAVLTVWCFAALATTIRVMTRRD